jgi:O-antigen/teichoic acid export membrane protein
MFKNFFRDSVGFTVANICVKALNIILVPIYIRYLSFDDYGAFELITTLTVIFVVVVTLELTQSIIRFVPDNESNEILQRSYISSAVHTILFSCLIFVFLVYFFSPWISNILFKSLSYSQTIKLIGPIIALQALNYSIAVTFRSKREFSSAIFHSLMVASFVGGFGIVFLISSSGNLNQFLLGQIIGGSASVLIGFYKIRSLIFYKINWLIVKQIVSFSFPLILSGIAIHLSTFADRLIINELLSLESLAVYGIAAKAASLVTIVISGVQGTLAPHFISSWNSSSGLRSLSQIFFIYLILSIFLLFFLYVFGEHIIIFLGTNKAASGVDVLLILASSAVINGLNIFLFGLIKSLKTSILSLIYLCTAILNIVLNYYFISEFGILGAAIATLIATSIGFLVHFYFSSKHLKLPFSSLIPICFIITLLGFNFFYAYIS